MRPRWGETPLLVSNTTYFSDDFNRFDDDRVSRTIIAVNTHFRDLIDDLLAGRISHFAEDGVLAVEVRGLGDRDEEL